MRGAVRSVCRTRSGYEFVLGSVLGPSSRAVPRPGLGTIASPVPSTGLIGARALTVLVPPSGLRLVPHVCESPKRVEVSRESEDGGRYSTDQDDDRLMRRSAVRPSRRDMVAFPAMLAPMAPIAFARAEEATCSRRTGR